MDRFFVVVVATLISSSTAEEKLFINSGKFEPGFLKQQDGAFSLESEEGCGATATINLPSNRMLAA